LRFAHVPPTFLLLTFCAAAPCVAYQFSAGDTGIVLSDDSAGAPIVAGLKYTAVDEGGTAFSTTSARLEGDVVRFALDGPAAAQATVEAKVTRLPRGIGLDFAIRCEGPARRWNGWNSGFGFAYGRPLTDAYAAPVTRWVQPTGAHEWEVAGDTP